MECIRTITLLRWLVKQIYTLSMYVQYVKGDLLDTIRDISTAYLVHFRLLMCILKIENYLIFQPKYKNYHRNFAIFMNNHNLLNKQVLQKYVG